jgi:uncharacterized damage-inducible protein DinB
VTVGDAVLQALLEWNRAESRRWHAWFSGHRSALDLPIGEGRTASVRRLIHHVFVVDLRYAQRLVGLPVSAYETLDGLDLDGLFALAERAHALLAGWLAGASEADLSRAHTFTTLSAGTLDASARKIVVHACTHHLRHWAQIATVLRLHGQPSDWVHDFMMSDVMR